jgi:hypothetical protein
VPKEVKLGIFLAITCVCLSVIFAAINLALWYGAGIAIDKLVVIVPLTLGMGIAFAVKPGGAVFSQDTLSGSFLMDLWNAATRLDRIVWCIGCVAGLIAGVIAWYALKAFLR